MPRLLISAAHTLENPGEVYGDLREADITRKILIKTLPYLDARKIEYKAVPLDLQLLKRIDWIRDSGYSKEQGDIFLEIHVNDGGKRGIEGWYEGSPSEDNASQKFADAVVNGICKHTGYQNQGVKSEYQHDLGSLIILNQSNLIATAVECLYIDNPEDISILKEDSKLEDLAKAIADSINDYIINIAPTNKAIEKTAPNYPMLNSPASPFAGSPGFSNTGSSNFASKPTPFNGQVPTFGNTGAQFGSNPQNRPVLMDREERKEMIKKLYLKVLGKEPNQNDLNYHLNTGITEQELLKKLIDGEDHTKLVQNAGQFKELSDKTAKLQAEIDQLKASQNDAKVMQATMNRLLEQKNVLIARLHQELANHNIIVHGGHIDSIRAGVKPVQTPQISQPKGKRTFVDFLMDIFKL